MQLPCACLSHMRLAGNLECAKALVVGHADASIAAEHGVTALHAAAELGNLELVHLLLQVCTSLPAFCMCTSRMTMCRSHMAAVVRMHMILSASDPRCCPGETNASWILLMRKRLCCA